MRLALVGLLGLSILNMKGCDLSKIAEPQSVANSYQDALHPYFPAAKAIALPDQQVLLGITCVQGDGVELVKTVGSFLTQVPEIKELKTLRNYGPLFGAKTYQYAGLGFQSGIVRLNVDSWTSDVVLPTPEYTKLYDTMCGVASVGAQSVYIAHISVTVDTPNGRRTTTWTDSLGVWLNDAKFEQHRAQELAFVDSLIREDMASRGFTYISSQLVSIEKKPI